jgi:hypothetical protein
MFYSETELMPAVQKEKMTQMYMHVLRPARLRSRRMVVTNGNCLFVFIFTVFRTPRSKLVCSSKRVELHVLNLFSFAQCFERHVLNNGRGNNVSNATIETSHWFTHCFERPVRNMFCHV